MSDDFVIPKDGFWAPIYYSMFATGIQPLSARASELYALADRMEDYGKQYQQTLNGVEGLSSGIDRSLQSETAEAFRRRARGLANDVSDQVSGVNYQAYLTRQFGLNAKENNMEAMTTAAWWAAEIFALLASPWGWAALGEWIG